MESMAATNYRAVLTAPGSFRLMSTALVGRLPQGMSSLAVLLLVRQATGSYAAALANGLAWNALNIAIMVGLLLRARSRLAPA